MLIKALSVEGIGRFTRTARVDGFSDGVNVLSAGNEAGKSTLFRAIRTCLFCRHDSKVQDIKDLCSEEGQLPGTVELAFQSNGQTYVIRKSFWRSPSAILIENGREVARAKRADEAVWELLGLNPGTGRTLDDGAFGLLWVGQRASFATPAPSPAASSALNSAIEAEVGALVGGERARQILEALKSELDRSLTDGDKPKKGGPLARAIHDVEQYRAAESDARTKVNTLEQQFANLLTLRQRRQELTDPSLARQMADDLAEAKNSLEEARSSTQEIRRLEAEESSAKLALEKAAQKLNQFRELVRRIDGNRGAIEDLRRELLGQQQREQDARDALSGSQGMIAQADEEARTLSAQEQQLGKLETATVRALRKGDLTRQREALECSAADLTRINAELAQIKVTPHDTQKLDAFDRQIASLDAQSSAAAAQLAVEIKPAGAGQVRIGMPTGVLEPEGTYRAAMIATTKITVGELADITVTPPPSAQFGDRLAAEREKTSLLASLSAKSSAEAHAMLAKRRELEAERQGVLAELKALQVAGDPAPAIAATQSELAEIEAAVNAVLSDTNRDRLPTVQEIEAEKLELAEKRSPLDARRANLEATREEQQSALEKAVETRSATESNIELLRKEVEKEIASCPDGERTPRENVLVADVTKAEGAYQIATTVLAAKRQIAPDAAELERRQARYQRLEKALANRNKDLIELEGEIGRITGQIQAAGGDGIGEELAIAQQERSLAERDLARIEERISTLRLLRETISQSLKEGREHYYEPVRRHLRPFMNDLFPGADLELGDGFTVAGIRRDRKEAFSRLSDGTQEQIAVLVRLAMASMLAERGQIVPVILDDALVYCDDDRIKRMFDALCRAGKHHQVIVLTCRLRTFAPLGGNTLRIQSAP